jgi:hypothetical protein
MASVSLLISTGIQRSDASSPALGYYIADACTIKCHSGCTFGEGWEGHDAESQGGSGGGLQHVECMGGVNCANIHGCGGNEVFESDLKSVPSRWRDHVDRLHALQESAVRGDVSAALELLSAYPDHAEFNEARQSIQLAGCSKDVLSGNIPLSDAQLSAISAVQ